MKQLYNLKSLTMNKLFYILFFCLYSLVGFSQDREDKIEKIKALRVAYITERLQLKPEEAEKFWPLFNSFDNKQMELHKQKRQIMHKLRPENTSNLTEKETTQLMEEDEKIEFEMMQNKRTLAKSLQGVIPNQKILMLRQIEIEFKEKLLEKMKNRRERMR